MAQQSADHAQIQPGIDPRRRKAVAQIMQADPIKFCALPELAPDPVNPVVRHWVLALTEHVLVAARKGGQNPFCRAPEPDRARSGLGIWQSTARTIDHVPAEGEGFPFAAAGEGEKAEAACLTRVGFLKPPQSSSQPGPLCLGEIGGLEACLAAPQPLARVAAGRLEAKQFRVAHHAGQNGQCPVAAGSTAGQPAFPGNQICPDHLIEPLSAQIGEDEVLDVMCMGAMRGRFPARGEILEIVAAEGGHRRGGIRSATFFHAVEQRAGQLASLGQGDRIGPPECLLL